eukprot:326338-Chlamydomonas_euryale.AAC.2
MRLASRQVAPPSMHLPCTFDTPIASQQVAPPSTRLPCTFDGPSIPAGSAAFPSLPVHSAAHASDVPSACRSARRPPPPFLTLLLLMRPRPCLDVPSCQPMRRRPSLEPSFSRASAAHTPPVALPPPPLRPLGPVQCTAHLKLSSSPLPGASTAHTPP